MTSTLTERYIAAVTRALPPHLQTDVREELAASITDDRDARVAGGEPPLQAERAVVTALGDPDALAARFADRPLHLIGPRYYFTWWRLLKLLWIIAPLCAVVGVLIAKLLENAPVGEIIGAVIGVGIGAFVHVGFWTTLVFFILERTGADTGVRWDPDTLPEPQETGASRSDLISSLILLGIAAGLLLWDRFVGIVFFAFDGVDIGQGLGGQATAVSLLNTELWPWSLGALLGVIALEAALAIAVYARRGWNTTLAALNTILALVVAIPSLYLLLTEQILNPAFTAHMHDVVGLPDEVGRILLVLTAVTIVGVVIWDIIDAWRKSRR